MVGRPDWLVELRSGDEAWTLVVEGQPPMTTQAVWSLVAKAPLRATSILMTSGQWALERLSVWGRANHRWLRRSAFFGAGVGMVDVRHVFQVEGEASDVEDGHGGGKQLDDGAIREGFFAVDGLGGD